MSGTSSNLKPERKRAAVPTYNLKVLSGLTTRSPKSDRKKHTASNSSSQSPAVIQIDSSRKLAAASNMSNPLSSPMSSPPPSTRGTPLRRATTQLQQQQRYQTGPGSASTHSSLAIKCFNKHSNRRGHFYSAVELYNHGVWVGFLHPDRHSESYKDLPSYSELKSNYDDLRLPHPQATASGPSKSRFALCRGCLSEESVLLTLREMNFAHKKSLVIMPLDGDDNVGLFCILLPQPMDRSMKNIESWRPYEVVNAGDGRKFSNNFLLLTLRYPDQVGTRDTILAALRSSITGNIMPEESILRNLPQTFSLSPTKTFLVPKRKSEETRISRPEGQDSQRANLTHSAPPLSARVLVDASTVASKEPPDSTAPLEPALMDNGVVDSLRRVRSVSHTKGSLANKRKSRADDNSSPEQHKRQCTGPTHGIAPESTEVPADASTDASEVPCTTSLEPAVPETEPVSSPIDDQQQLTLQTSINGSLPELSPPMNVPSQVMTRAADCAVDTPPALAPATLPAATPVRDSSAAATLATVTVSARPNLTEEQAQNIQISWVLDTDGEVSELPLLMAECRSFQGLLDLLIDMAQFVPAATVLLQNTKTWSLSYPFKGGVLKRQIARKGTEVAFDLMIADLAQSSSATGSITKVQVIALS